MPTEPLAEVIVSSAEVIATRGNCSNLIQVMASIPTSTREVVAERHETPELDVPLSAAARAALDAGLESARLDIASGRPLTPWIRKHVDEDED